MKRLALAVLIALALPAIANACPVCFGDPNAPMNKGTANAIWFLLGIVGVVQAAFIALFITFWRRSREARKGAGAVPADRWRDGVTTRNAHGRNQR